MKIFSAEFIEEMKVSLVQSRLKRDREWHKKTIRELHSGGYWVDRDLNVIHYTKIDKRYASNIMDFLYRKAEKEYNEAVSAGYSMLGFLQGEMAIDCAESGLTELENGDPMMFLNSHPFVPYLRKILN